MPSTNGTLEKNSSKGEREASSTRMLNSGGCTGIKFSEGEHDIHFYVHRKICKQ